MFLFLYPNLRGFYNEKIQNDGVKRADFGFYWESVYSIQLEAKANANDILLCFSGSGNSPNVIKAIQTAKEKGMTVIGFTGRDGGKMKTFCDLVIIAPTYCMEQIEDLHMMYVHALAFTIAKTLTECYEKQNNQN